MYLPSAKSIVLSSDSILDFYRTHHLSMTDNYISKDSCFMDLGTIVQKLNEVYVYNSANHKLIFYDGESWPAFTFKVAIKVEPAGINHCHCPDNVLLSGPLCMATPSMATLVNGSAIGVPSTIIE